MEQVIDWLKTSIPGILILGIIGSILAVYVLDALKWIGRRFFLKWLILYLTHYATWFVFYRALTRRVRKNPSKVIFISLLSLAGCLIWLTFFLSSVIWTGYIFYYYPVVSWTHFISVVLTSIIWNLLFQELLSLAGIFHVLIRDDQKVIKEMMKDRNAWKVNEILDTLDAEELEKEKTEKFPMPSLTPIAIPVSQPENVDKPNREPPSSN